MSKNFLAGNGKFRTERGWSLGSIVAVLSLLLFSSNVLLTKAASARVSVNVGYFVSIIVNVIFAAILVASEHLVLHMPFTWNWVSFVKYIVAGSLTTFLGRLTYFIAIDRLGATRASTFQVASPVLTAVLAWIFLREALSPLQDFGIFFAILGLIVITGKLGTKGERHKATDHAAPSTGVRGPNAVWIALLSMTAYGVGNLLRGSAVRAWNDPVFGGLIGACVGLVAFAVTHPAQLARLSEIRKADRQGLLMYSIGGACTILAQISVLIAMRYLPIGVVTLVSMSQPLLVIPLGHFLLRGKDRISWRTGLGGLLTMMGLILAVRP